MPRTDSSSFLHRRYYWGVALVAALAGVAGGVWQKERRAESAPATNTDKLTVSDSTQLWLPVLRERAWQAPNGQFITPFAPGPRRWIINIWAPWCAPCVDEMPELSELAQSLKESQVQVVGLGLDTAANLLAFQQRIPVTYPVVIAGAEGLALAGRWGNVSGGVPFTVVLDESGRVLQRFSGRVQITALRQAVQ